MTTYFFRATLALTFAVLLGLACTVPAAAIGEKEFHVLDGVLMRGEDTAEIHAIYAPDAGQGGGSNETMLPAMAKIASVGANTICFDLTEISEDGSHVSATALRTVRTIYDRADTQGMRVMVNVLGNSTDPTWRRNAIKAAAKRLRNEPRVLYLIDGPNAGDLTDMFKSKAPRCMVVSPRNGDLRLSKDAPGDTPDTASLYADHVVGRDDAEAHFLLDGSPESYTALDNALMHPSEKETWNHDPAILSKAEQAEGFVPIFNGKDLSGWRYHGDNENGFNVDPYGFIQWREEGGTALLSAKRYGDFTLRIEYKILSGGNSGIFLRAPRDCRQSYIGMEFQLRGDHGIPPGEDQTGALYMQHAADANPSNPGGEWNALEITLKGMHIKAILNDVVIHDYDLTEHEDLAYRNQRGFIGLQDHNDYVCFRNIRIKEL